MGVIMQAFYWDCPKLDNLEYQWWRHVRQKLHSLKQAGFTAIWLPPVNKAASVTSMGYDPYDYYDLGEIYQKGGVATWFGTKAELLDLINTAHEIGLHVYADIVFNHNSGADAQEVNPIDNQSRWTKFKPASGKFNRDWSHFHPSWYESWDDMTFGDMPDLCHRNPKVYTELLEYGRWLIEEVGFDGFRYDCVKGYGGWMVRSIQELRARRNNASIKPYGVGECWDSTRTIHEWLDEANAWSDNPVGAFDFPLRYRLRDLCNTSGYSLKNLVQPGVLLYDRPRDAVTFVENHDVVRDDPVIYDKMMAYAFILTHEGYPCVFWQDYFNWNLAQESNRGGIAALIQAHEHHAGGATGILYVDDELYIMERRGFGECSGLVFVLNNRGAWHGTRVMTRWANTRFTAVAWRGRDDSGTPQDQWTDAEGGGEFWAPPRGYVVYIPQGA